MIYQKLSLMQKNEYVSLESLEKIANVLNCEIGDLVEIVKKDTEEAQG